MTSDESDNEQIKEVFRGALAINQPEERTAFLEEACGGDTEFFQSVQQMLEEKELEKKSGSTGRRHDDGTLVPAIENEQSGAMIGRYKLLEKIGEGGFGSVYMADQQTPVQRRVALKIIKKGMDSREVIARFEAERQALALMDDPNIAKVLDAGTTETGRPYFVMELVNGVPITQFCKQRRLETRERLNIFMDVCSAVQHAHQKGVIHRDLKPSNILVTLHGDKPVPKVIDFGIAKATQQQLTDKTLFTRFEQFIGTPVYMSPEQAVLSGLDIDTRSDIYSLGVLLYELLIGKPPFDAKSLLSVGYDEMRRIIREDDPPKPSSRLSTMAGPDREVVAREHHSEPDKLDKLVKGDLDWIVMKAIEKDRSRRYETANALALDIRRHLHDEPVRAAAPKVTYRLQKFVRRNRAAVAWATTLAILLVGGVAISTFFAVEATGARNREYNAKGELKVQLEQTRQARDAENREWERAEETVQRLHIQQAENHIQTGEVSLGLAYLARVVRDHPENRVAAGRLVDLLIHGNFPKLACEPISDETNVASLRFSPDGLTFVTSGGNGARIWSARTGKPIGVPMEHDDLVNSAIYSQDGKEILTASSDKTARVWDGRTGAPLGMPMRHERKVVDAEFSPDGKMVATASFDHTACLWDSKTGLRIGQPMRHEDQVFSVNFSSDGRYLATASRDKTARIWEAKSGRELGAPMEYEYPISSAKFSPDGMLLLTSCYDHSVLLWDVATRQRIGDAMQHESRIFSAEFSPDGRRVVTASYDKTARLWDGRTGRSLGQTLHHQDQVWFAEFSPDGHRVVTASQDKTVRLWNGLTGAPLGQSMTHHDSVRLARFSPDGQRVLTAGRDKVVSLWDVRTQPRGEPMRHSEGLTSAKFSPDGRRVVTSSYDKTARLWNAETGQLLGIPLVHTNYVDSAEFSPDGQRVLTASVDQTARVWDVASGQQLGDSIRIPGFPVEIAKFSPDGERMVLVTSDSIARLWDLETRQALGDPMVHKKRIISVEFSSDGRRLVTASYDQTAQVWDSLQGTPIGSPMKHEDFVESASFSPDGMTVVTASKDGTVRFWDSLTGKQVGEPIRHGEFSFLSARFSPDGERLMTVSMDHSARLWDTKSRLPVGQPMLHSALILSAEFSKDGRRIVTSSFDNTARLWDTLTGLPLGEPLYHSSAVIAASFSPDGRRLVTGSRDKTARVWAIPESPTPVHAWVADWGEAVGGKRLTEQGHVVRVAYKEMLALKERIRSLEEGEFYADAARWFFSDPVTRSISPWSPINLNEYVRRRVAEGSQESLREALLLSPTDGAAYAKLAQQLLSANPGRHSNELQEATLYARLAVKWSPTLVEAWKAMAEVEVLSENTEAALQAEQQALKLQADASRALELRDSLKETSESP